MEKNTTVRFLKHSRDFSSIEIILLGWFLKVELVSQRREKSRQLISLSYLYFNLLILFVNMAGYYFTLHFFQDPDS